MTDETVVVPFADLADDLPVVAVTAEGPVLLGAHCSACDAVWFPTRPVCPTCSSPDPGVRPAGPGGVLYSYTTVHVSSSRPTPYTLGFVDVDGGVRVLATIEADGPLELDSRCHLEVGGDGRWWFSAGEQK